MQKGITNLDFLQQIEDFIVVDDDVLLFYDTTDLIGEGAAPNESMPYGISIATLTATQASTDLLHRQVNIAIQEVLATRSAIKLKSYSQLQKIVDS
mgnify:FL=1